MASSECGGKATFEASAIIGVGHDAAGEVFLALFAFETESGLAVETLTSRAVDNAFVDFVLLTTAEDIGLVVVGAGEADGAGGVAVVAVGGTGYNKAGD